MKKIICKYYVSSRSLFSPEIELTLVRGTVGKKEFMVLSRECIVGSNTDTRISLDDLFDDFVPAADFFLKRSAVTRRLTVRKLEAVDKACETVSGMLERWQSLDTPAHR